MSVSPAIAVRDAERQLGTSVGYSILHRNRWIKTLKYLEKFCPPTTHRKLFDVGVWPGYQSLALQHMGYEVLGLDLDPSRLPKLPFLTHAFDLNQQDHFPIPDHSLDIVVATEIIEHIAPERLPVFIAAARAALRPGGYLLITTPNRRHVGAIMKPRAGGTDAAGHGHTHEYTVSELRAYFISGWQDCSIDQVDMYSGVGKVTNENYYRPLWQWWRHPRRLHNGLKIVSGLAQALVPLVRDTLVVVAQA